MKHTFTTEGRYVDTTISAHTDGDLLRIEQYNVEKDNERTYLVGRIALNSDEFFELYNKISADREEAFDAVVQYADLLMNVFGTVSIQTARALHMIASKQCSNFLVLLGDKRNKFHVMTFPNPEDQLRMEENFEDRVVASCRNNKLRIMRKGFKK